MAFEISRERYGRIHWAGQGRDGREEMGGGEAAEHWPATVVGETLFSGVSF